MSRDPCSLLSALTPGRASERPRALCQYLLGPARQQTPGQGWSCPDSTQGRARKCLFATKENTVCVPVGAERLSGGSDLEAETEGEQELLRRWGKGEKTTAWQTEGKSSLPRSWVRQGQSCACRIGPGLPENILRQPRQSSGEPSDGALPSHSGCSRRTY